MNKEQLATVYADKCFPDANSIDAPYSTTGDRHEEVKEAFLVGYEAAEPKWISVEDQMPAIGQEVLVYMPKCSITPIETQRCYLTGKDIPNWNKGFRKGEGFEITHWIPLPSPPKTK